MNPVVIISQAVATGGLSGARPVLTLFLLQLYAYFVGETNMAGGLEWVLSPYVIGVLGALTVVEHYIRTDADFEQLMKVPNQIINTATAMMTAFLLVNMGYETNALPAAGTEVAASWDTLLFTAGAGTGEGQSMVMTVSVIAAGLMSVGVTWLRSQLVDFIDAMAVPSKWWRWIEAGGVAGLVTVVVLLPFLALAMAILVVVVSALAAGILWSVRRTREKLSRGPCPSCGYDLRQEASVCPSCGHEASPRKVLATPAAEAAA